MVNYPANSYPNLVRIAAIMKGDLADQRAVLFFQPSATSSIR
jgi:hypothetical protein